MPPSSETYNTFANGRSNDKVEELVKNEDIKNLIVPLGMNGNGHDRVTVKGDYCERNETMVAFLKPVLTLLDQNSTMPKLIMWSYFAWYIVVVSLTPNKVIKPFFDASVIMLLIGFVLNANAFIDFRCAEARCPASTVPETSLKWYLKLNHFSALRLFMIPYAVSSYSGLAASSPKGTFWSVIPTNSSIWIPALSIAIGLPATILVLKAIVTNVLEKTIVVVPFNRNKDDRNDMPKRRFSLATHG